MFHSILAHFVSHWKIEAFVASIVLGITLLANQLTSPAVLAVMVIILEWDYAITKQMLISTVASAITFFGVWLLQKNIQANRDKKREAEAAALKKTVDLEKERADKATTERSDLLDRVKSLENESTTFRQNMALMSQQATPLFEAAKIKLIETLTHPSPEFKIPDALLAQVKNDNVITPQLRVMLKERETSTHPEVTADEKLAAAILPIVVELAANEKAALDTLPRTSQVVSSPGKPEAKREAEERQGK